MRGLFILGLLLGLLYYGLLNKEAIDHELPLLRAVKEQVSDIAERENDRAYAAKNCSAGDDEYAADCLQQSFSSPSYDSASDSDLEDSDTPRKKYSKRSSDYSGGSGRALSQRVNKRLGGSDIQGF